MRLSERWRGAILGVVAIGAAFAATCFLDSLRYPRIARGAYWRHPHLLVRATLACAFPGKGASRHDVLTHARSLTDAQGLEARLLYLPDWPRDDKAIRDRVIGLIAQTYPRSEECLFWIVTPQDTGRSDLQGAVVYEYRTGRLVCHWEQ